MSRELEIRQKHSNYTSSNMRGITSDHLPPLTGPREMRANPQPVPVVKITQERRFDTHMPIETLATPAPAQKPPSAPKTAGSLADLRKMDIHGIGCVLIRVLDGPLTSEDLKQQFRQYKRKTISATLSKLKQRGLVEPVPKEHGTEADYFRLTPLGREFRLDIMKRLDSARKRSLKFGW